MALSEGASWFSVSGIRGRVRSCLRPCLKAARCTLRSALAALGERPFVENDPNAPDIFRHWRSLAATPSLTRLPGGWLYQGKFYPDYLTVGGASHAIFRTATKFCQGHGFDIGAGLWPMPGALPVDTWRGPGAGRTLADIPDGALDYVFSSHCLEHIEEWPQALRDWVAKVRPGGRRVPVSAAP